MEQPRGVCEDIGARLLAYGQRFSLGGMEFQDFDVPPVEQVPDYNRIRNAMLLAAFLNSRKPQFCPF
ncbi:unnamed protein product [Ranitomeya imitator]|uniref:Uncharacterized protein n=1 Tax=Ranitomeya imitator TaxID=111125 RepID=A0ABN9M5T4_9NEOB|nr:unnamed protein product [Ranitomeya imitator]